jgi:uncharacterized protein (TIGR03067 family)
MKRLSQVVFAMLLVMFGRVFADDVETSKNRERAELLGEWKFQWIEVDGQRNDPAETEAPVKVVFDQTHVHHNDKKTAYSIDTTTDPKLIDFDLTDDPDFRRTIEGIYKIEKGKLTICIFLGDGPSVRPTDFATKPDSKLVLIQLGRSDD